MIYVLISCVLLMIVLFMIYVKGNFELLEESISSLNIEIDNITIAKEMLKIIKNNHTKVEYNKDEKSNLSYYNHKKDVIIVKVNKKVSSRIVQIAHECIHTTQKNEFLNANKNVAHKNLYIFSKFYKFFTF